MRTRRCGLSAGIAALVWSTTAAAAVVPLAGTYNGHVSTNAGHGLPPQAYSMTVSHSSCAPPGGGKAHTAWCVVVSPQSIVQVTCADGSILEPFFPVTEPIALTSAGTISHHYTLYYSATTNQSYEHHVPGSVKVATFAFALKVDGHGNASGTARFQPNGASGACDSGVVEISAKLAK